MVEKKREKRGIESEKGERKRKREERDKDRRETGIREGARERTGRK